MIQARELEKEYNAKLFLISAYTGEGVNEAFGYLFN
jgi:hypothetical protein